MIHIPWKSQVCANIFTINLGTFSSPEKEILPTLAITPLLPHNLPKTPVPEQPLLSVSIDFPIVNILYRWSLCLLPDLRGKAFSLSPWNRMLAVGFSRSLSGWGNSLYLLISRVFLYEKILDLVRCFLSVYWGNHVSFTFYSVDMMYCCLVTKSCLTLQPHGL